MTWNVELLLGLLLAGIGVLLWFTTTVLFRVPPDKGPVEEEPTISFDENPAHVTLLISKGGLIASISPAAKLLFGLTDDDEPELESISKRIRPPEILFQLAAHALDVQVNISGINYHVSSFPVADGKLVVFRKLQETDLDHTQPSFSSQTINNLSQMTRLMAASLDLGETLLALFENISKLVPADLLEITIWDEDNRHLVPYRMEWNNDQSKRIVKGDEPYQVGQGFSGTILQSKNPLLIDDTSGYHQSQQALDRTKFPLRSYMGFPLKIGEEVIGTLELGDFQREAFSKDDSEVIQLICDQAAIAIHNALLFQREQRRSTELSGLAQVAQSFSAALEPEKLYERLIASISPLIQVEMVGFLIFNENTRMLEAQKPFKGLPDPFVEIFKTEIPNGSFAEELLLAHQVIITEKAVEDQNWHALGIDHLAIAASIRDTALIPLYSSSHTLGFLLVSNHHEGYKGFTQDKIHLLMILANQAAPVIENTALIQQSRQRAQRAETLRRIASLASSNATLNEILKYSIRELSHLLRADIGVVFLLNRDRTILETHLDSLHSDMEVIQTQRLSTEDAQFPFTMTGSQHTMVVGLFDETKPIVPFYQRIIDEWRLLSVVIVPLVVRDEGIGEIWFGSRNANFYDQGDIQVIVPAASQLASVVEQTNLAGQTDETLRQRINQLTALTRISRELSMTLDLKYLMQVVYDEAIKTTRADTCTIVLFEKMGAGNEPEQLFLRFQVGDIQIDEVTELESRIINSGKPAVFSSEDKEPGLIVPEDVQSILILPVLYHLQPAGMIYLFSNKPDQFQEAEIEIAESLAAQAAIALGNAQQFEEQARQGQILKREVEIQQKFFQVSEVLRPEQPFEKSLDAIAAAVQEVTPFDAVLISVYDSSIEAFRRVTAKGISLKAWLELSSNVQPWEPIKPLLKEEYRQGNAYFISYDALPVVPENVHMVSLLPGEGVKVSDNRWHPDDLCVVPMYAANGEPVGLISVDSPRDGFRPDRLTYEALSLFAVQAGLLIENHNYKQVIFDQTSFDERDLSSKTTDPSESNRDDWQYELAIRPILELTSSFSTVLNGGEQANPYIGCERLAEKLLVYFGFETCIIVHQEAEKPLQVLSVLDELPIERRKIEVLLGQNNPLRAVLQGDDSILWGISQENQQTWNNSPLVRSLEICQFLAFSVQASTQIKIAFLFASNKNDLLIPEPIRLQLRSMLEQYEVFLNEQSALRETQDHLNEVQRLLLFSQQLAILDTNEILDKLLESVMNVISQAQAGWVGLVDEQNKFLQPQISKGYSQSESLLSMKLDIADQSSKILNVLQTFLSLRLDEVDFAHQYPRSQDFLNLYRQATGGRLPVSSLIVPIHVGESRIGVLCLENFDTITAFGQEDENLVYALAQQASLALENARLFDSSEKRSLQMQALTNAASEITANLNTDELVATLLPRLQKVVAYDTATLWLRTENDLRIMAVNGFDDQESRIGIRVNLEDSQLFISMQERRRAVVVPDVREDARFSSLMEPERLSWLGIPLLVQAELKGVLAMEKKEAHYFREDQVQAASTFAYQAAVALENAKLFEEAQHRTADLDQRSKRLALLNRFSVDVSEILDVQHIIKITLNRLLSALNYHQGSIILIEAKLPRMAHAVPDFTVPNGFDLSRLALLERLMETQGVYAAFDVKSDPELRNLVETYFLPRNTASVLFIPLRSGTAILGWVLIESPEMLRFGIDEIELSRTIANQAAVAIQNARLLEETRSLTEDLEKRVQERTQEMMREHHNSQMLLKITTELSSSLDMDQVLSRTLSVLNDAMQAQSSLIILAQREKFYYAGLQTFDLTDGGSLTDASLEKTIGRWVMRERTATIVDDLAEDSRWAIDHDTEIPFRSLLAVPLKLGEELLGVLLVTHSSRGYFMVEQIDLVEAVARQVSVALNNAELYSLIRDQAENLGNMLREQKIEASRSRSMLEAVADGVLVTDANNRITLLNESAEKILDLNSRQVIGKSIESLSGLFGSSANTWMYTIKDWAQDLSSYTYGDTYAEQLTLENDQIISVHLAPVFWQTNFLGTVSVFRDITLEVQVDRMKSEFIANVSHELRTPLTAIKGYADIMLMGAAGEISGQQKHFLEIMRSNTVRLNVLVNDLLDISRIETGRFQLQIQSIDMLALSERVTENIKRRAEEDRKKMHFHIEPGDDLPLAQGDEERVFQVLNNLVGNAYNYTPQDGEITIRVSGVDSRVQIDVSDNGIGIAPEHQGRVFERFFRGEDPLVLATAGTGLGLAVAKTIVEMHGGEIWFNSTGVPGDGSTFTFTLPTNKVEG